MVVTFALPGLMIAGCASASSTPEAKLSVGAVSPRPCSASQLVSRVAAGGSEGSQPWLIIDVTDNGSRCSIDGYPRIVAAVGHTLQGPSHPLSISVSDGPDYEHLDPGPHPVGLSHGASASFAVGTNTASGTVCILTFMTVALQGSQHPRRVPVHTAASAFVNDPVDIEVTALVKGSNGPPAVAPPHAAARPTKGGNHDR